MKKRIALIGNMNNNFFALTQYLLEVGYDANLFFHLGASHFQPKADTFKLEFTKFCKAINWFGEGLSDSKLEICRNDLAGYNYFIGMGDEAAFAVAAGINFDIYFPYGSDFYKFAWLPPNFSFSQRLFMKVNKNTSFKQSGRGTMATYIRKAIVNAENVFLDYTNPEYEKKLTDLDLKGKFKNIPIPFIYLKEYQQNDLWDTHWKHSIDKLREENQFLLLYHGRQEWKTEYENNDFTNKNTHHLILGFAEFIKLNPNLKTTLIMLEYGGDVINSKNLINKLGISEQIVWFPMMYRKDLMYLIKSVDVCSGEFGKSFLTFGTIIEAMLMGKPIIHYRLDKLYFEKFDELYPLYNARESSEICNVLIQSFNNEEARVEMGQKARDWVMKYFINIPLQKIINTIEN
jgi:glycosyltransferase involved in cell wall biosynthesis